ncbi:MAG: MoxR family ATPase [Chloroflexi bacterium]|nr:MoxR family ATPase [Chloroflexota bacterium]
MDGVETLYSAVEQVVIGKRSVTSLLLVALLCEGHVLLEDVPGVGKTLLAKTLAGCLECSFRRLQFPPDMLPSDITGSHVFNQQTAQFEFRAGPVFTNIVLADEINRATPRTQSALLEAMEERQVSVDGETMTLPRPFLVAATQNPVELEGTFPLPEAQLDRFLLKARMDYPSEDDEAQILLRFAAADSLPAVRPVLQRDRLVEWQAARSAVRVTDDVRGYLLRVVRGTREHPDLELGASPRAALALYRAVQAWAALDGRDFVIPDDVKALAGPVIAHRLIVSAAARLRGVAADQVLAGIINSMPVPVEAL